jgi:negative regulator of flagellin synthesis FlgM
MSIDLRDINNHRHLHGQRPLAEPSDQTARGGRQSSAGTEAVDGAADKVELSTTARTLKTLGEAVHASDGVDAAKVERIRQQIAEGRYHVDAGKLADRMIDLEQMLG